MWLRLVCQLGAHRVDALALGLEHRGHGMLREPVDLEVGVELPQLAGDRDVALGVPEPDRRADEERAPPARAAACPAARLGARPAKSRSIWLTLHGVTHLRRVARALEQDCGGAELVREVESRCCPADRPPSPGRRARGSARGSTAPSSSPDRSPSCPSRGSRRDRLGVGLQAPADAVLDRLCRVRLGKALREEVLQVALPVPQPVMAILLCPALVRVEDLVERVVALLGPPAARSPARSARARRPAPGGSLRG